MESHVHLSVRTYLHPAPAPIDVAAERPDIEKEIEGNLAEAARKDLEERRETLDLPAIDREMLASLLADFENVMAEGTNQQRKDLLHLVVKKVLVHDRRSLEIRYALPNSRGIEISNKWLPGQDIARTARAVVEAIVAA